MRIWIQQGRYGSFLKCPLINKNMKKKYWFIPILIIAVTALAILMCWSSLPEVLPAHFDLKGNASGSMPRTQLLMFPLISVVALLICHVVARLRQKLQKGLVVLSSGICIVILLSVLVTLTRGTMPILMLAEPVVLLAAVVGLAVCIRYGK